MISQDTNTINAFVSRLDNVRGNGSRFRATCPACGRRGALSVSEGRDGVALAKCFARCDLRDITAGVCLQVADLFPKRDRESLSERDAQRRRFATAPRKTLDEALKAERERRRAQLRSELGYDRPWRSNDENDVRRRVARAFGITEAPTIVRPFVWECAPHDTDPAWPALFRRALEEEVRRRWLALHSDAAPWETDVTGATIFDRIRAEELAREWMRGMSQ
jgi:hypothetical protein